MTNFDVTFFKMYMLKDGRVFIWELDMNLVFTLVDRPKSGSEPFGMGQMATFEAKINLGAKAFCT